MAELIEELVDPTEDRPRSPTTRSTTGCSENVRTSHHISGTCKMGPVSDRMAVVDQHGRVYGTEGLRVADASIMPDCIRANTNATSIMIGERVADFITEGV